MDADPLGHIRGLAQFPRSVRVPPDSNALDAIHQFIKSRGAKNPDKVLEEAKMIVDGGSELLNCDYVAFTSSMGIGEASPRKENVNPQERRPGFGRRRPKFSMKAKLCQPPASLLTSFDGAKFPDPDEYFAEFKKHENAQNEIKRLMGGCGSSSIDEEILSHSAMKRRPGILGDRRRPVTFKHRYSQVISEAKERIVASPEPVELTVPKPSNNSNSRQTNFDVEVEPHDNDAAGSITKTEDEVNRILDELISSNSEDLDNCGALSLLQTRLDIKPIDLDFLDIPNFIASEKIDFVALGQNLPKPQRSSFVLENFKQRTPVSDKQMGRSANGSLESSTPRHLFGSLSSLRRRVIQPNPLVDLFSPTNIDITSPKNRPDEGSEPTETNKGLGERSSGSLAGVSPRKTPSRQSSHTDIAQNTPHLNFLVNDDDNEMDGRMEHISTENAVDHNLVDGVAQEKENVEDAPSLPMSSIEELERTKNDSNNSLIDSHKPCQMEENVEDAPSLPMSSIEELERTKSDSSNSPIDSHKPSQMEENVKDMPPSAIFSAQVDISCKESMIPDIIEVDQRSFDEPHADPVKECTSDTLPTAPVNISEQETKKFPSKDQEHKRRRTAVGIIERKNLSKRKSILEGGTTFVSGLRRSKRIKTRPLEFWKGERFLYSRVNDSIKLTGFTYISPSKNDLKVKSFI